MAMAALPEYLQKQDLTQASPGLKFGMYLSFLDSSWSWVSQHKKEALKQASKLSHHDLELLKALRFRQNDQALSLLESNHLLRCEAVSIAPFSTGLGNEHPLENGFAFLNPYGLPYLAGSGVKGVLRQAATELASGEWGDTFGWNDSSIEALFGTASTEDNDRAFRGALSFWDVFPEMNGDALVVEVMTPHQSHYHQKEESPHDSGSPNPIHFLAVPPRSEFDFHILCDHPLLSRQNHSLAETGGWKPLIEAALKHAFEWLGFGAKTAVGYGAMAIDQKRHGQTGLALETRKKTQQAAAEEAKRLAEKSLMSPAERAIADLFDQRIDKNQDERAVLFSILKNGQCPEYRLEIARRLRILMQQQGRWREKTEKKDPQKDHHHQETLQVLKWLQ
ncbi:MAG: type III-B CRISPR module RAMP protein Cmr6 [Burkholderiales bacterium]